MFTHVTAFSFDDFFSNLTQRGDKHVYFYQGNTKLGVSEILIRKVYNKIREKLYLFYFIEYETDDISEENGP